jgi:hypothetical protein
MENLDCSLGKNPIKVGKEWNLRLIEVCFWKGWKKL